MAVPRTITISLPPELAKQVDRVASEEGRTRSELFREALRQYLSRRERWDGIFAYGRRLARERGWTEADVERAVEEERRSPGD